MKRARGILSVCTIAGLVVLWVCRVNGTGLPHSLAAGDFREFLLAQDLVFDGHVLRVQSMNRQPVGACGVQNLSSRPCLEILIRVDRVRSGVAEDSTLILSTALVRPRFPDDELKPGSQVLAWAIRDCDDGWRLWGGLCVVNGRGQVIAPIGSQSAVRLRDRPTTEPLPYAAIDSALSSTQTPTPSMSLFNGAAAVALMRLVRTSARGDDGYTYECDSLGWAIGTGARTPRYIDFPRIPGCQPGIFAGDSLLVPIPSGFSADHLAFDSCPWSLRLRNQHAPALAVAVGFLQFALGSMPGGSIFVRSFTSHQ